MPNLRQRSRKDCSFYGETLRIFWVSFSFNPLKKLENSILLLDFEKSFSLWNLIFILDFLEKSMNPTTRKRLKWIISKQWCSIYWDKSLVECFLSSQHFVLSWWIFLLSQIILMENLVKQVWMNNEYDA